MNKNNIILTATSLALAIGVLSADAKSFKRGVSENAFNLKEEIDVIKTGTSWFYTWGNVIFSKPLSSRTGRVSEPTRSRT